MEKKSKLIKIIQVLVLGMAGGSIYLMPYSRYIFYDWQIEAMGISNTQLGLLTTIYTIGNMIVYIPGGILSDKFSTKRSILFSLFSTALLSFVYSIFLGSYTLALVVWLLFAFTTTFLFWTSLMKTIRLVGDEDEQGFLFGTYFMGSSLTVAIINIIALRIGSLGNTVTNKFTLSVRTYAAAVLIAGILVLLVVHPDSEKAKLIRSNEFRLDQVKQLLKSPVVWIFSFIVFTGYCAFSSTNYFTPYLSNVVGISSEAAGYVSVIRNGVFAFMAPVSGFIADKVIKSTSKWFMTLFIILAILFLGVILIPTTGNATLIIVYTMLPGIFSVSLYGIVFSAANEAGISPAVMGTTVGLASVIGYLPDFFTAAMYGNWLDKYGNAGYNYIFGFLVVNCIFGLIASSYVYRKYKARQQSQPNQ